MVLLNVINHPRKVIVFLAWFAALSVPKNNVRLEVEQDCNQLYLVVIVANVINAESFHLVGLFKVICETEVCTASTTAKSKIIIMCKNDQNHSRQLLKPAHLAHKLKSSHKKRSCGTAFTRSIAKRPQNSMEYLV